MNRDVFRSPYFAKQGERCPRERNALVDVITGVGYFRTEILKIIYLLNHSIVECEWARGGRKVEGHVLGFVDVDLETDFETFDVKAVEEFDGSLDA